MNENLLTKGETAQVSQVEILVVKEFLTGNYLFRRNILNGKVEFADCPKGDAAELSDDNQPVYRALTLEALNSIIIRAKIEQILESGNPKSDIIEYVYLNFSWEFHCIYGVHFCPTFLLRKAFLPFTSGARCHNQEELDYDPI